MSYFDNVYRKRNIWFLRTQIINGVKEYTNTFLANSKNFVIYFPFMMKIRLKFMIQCFRLGNLFL